MVVEADGFLEFGERWILLELLPALFGVGEASHGRRESAFGFVLLGAVVLLPLRPRLSLALKWGVLARRSLQQVEVEVELSRRRLMASALTQLAALDLSLSAITKSTCPLDNLTYTRFLEKSRRNMVWPYQFVDLTGAQKNSRRTLLDTYGLVAQASAGVVLIVIQLFFLAQWLRRKRQQNSSDVPGSPSIKHSQKSSSPNFQAIERRWRRLEWWSGDSLVVFGVDCGTNGQVVAATLWTFWLLILSFAETGNGE